MVNALGTGRNLIRLFSLFQEYFQFEIEQVDYVELVAVAVPIVGAPGPVAATDAVLFEFAEAEPAEFVAVTTQRIVLPASAATSAYVLEVAPPIFVVTRCH